MKESKYLKFIEEMPCKFVLKMGKFVCSVQFAFHYLKFQSLRLFKFTQGMQYTFYNLRELLVDIKMNKKLLRSMEYIQLMKIAKIRFHLVTSEETQNGRCLKQRGKRLSTFLIRGASLPRCHTSREMNWTRQVHLLTSTFAGSRSLGFFSFQVI